MMAALDLEEQVYGGRFLWTGEWPGHEDCRRLDLWCYWGALVTGTPIDFDLKTPGRWVPCAKDHPNAQPDLNRLSAVAIWDKHMRQWERST